MKWIAKLHKQNVTTLKIQLYSATNKKHLSVLNRLLNYGAEVPQFLWLKIKFGK